MRFYSRAGLVALTLALFFATFAQGAPLRDRGLDVRSDAVAPLKRERLNIVVAERELVGPKYRVRAVTPVESVQATLVRRKSIFTKIKDGFKKLGKGIKNVAKKIGGGIKKAAEKVGSGIKKVAQKVGKGIKTAAKKVGNGIKTAAKKVGNGIKTAAKKVGSGIKTAAKKVGKFVKTTGAKVAKFGLKVWSAAQSIGAKVAKFIPGVGSVISKGLTAASAVTNAASNAIHVKLPGKLEKGINVLDKIRNPVSGAAGAVLGALRRDMELEELETLSSRDWEDILNSRDLEWEHVVKRDLGERDYAALGALTGRDMKLAVLEEVASRDLDEVLGFSTRDLEFEDVVERDLDFDARDFGELEGLDARSFDDADLYEREWDELEY